MNLSKICNIIVRKCCTQAKNSYFISTPIFYVNSAPHIGHLYTAVVSDAVQRWRVLRCPEESVFFLTGTDEHGMKIQQAAIQHNVPVEDYCTKISQSYKILFNQCNVAYTDFIRTTEERHEEAVKAFWELLVSSGDVYEARYDGWYCVADETFVVEQQTSVRSDGVRVSLESGREVEWTSETNFMFRLSAYQDRLVRWIQKDCKITPEKFKDLLLRWATEGDLPDISISRPASRISWGVPVPGRADHTVYVWLDALVNYLTATGFPDPTLYNRTWPPDLHVLGKDILKFHGIYWPAFLIAAKLEPPRGLLVHSHWTVDGHKMSKTRGNVVKPEDLLSGPNPIPSDALRYFLLRESTLHSDANYSEVKMKRILNAELADTFGNLLSRCCGKAINPRRCVPRAGDVRKQQGVAQLMDQVASLPDTVDEHYSECNFYRAVDAVTAVLRTANAFFESSRPWELARLKDDSVAVERLNAVLRVTMETLRVCGVTLSPIVPTLSARLLDRLNTPLERRTWVSLYENNWCGNEDRCLGSNEEVLFRRIVDGDENKGKKVKSKL